MARSLPAWPTAGPARGRRRRSRGRCWKRLLGLVAPDVAALPARHPRLAADRRDTNGPTPALIVETTVFVAGSTTAIEFLRICGTQTLPADDVGIAERRRSGSAIVATTAFVCGSIRAMPVVVVTQTASSEAAVQPAPPWIGILATTLCDAGSTRITPSLPVAQTEPKAPTAPVADRQLPAVHDLVPRRVDPFELALRERGRPRGAVGERRVVRRDADLDRGVRLPVVTETRLTVRRARVLDPHRAGAEAEPARAGADADLLDDLVRLRVDLEEVRLAVLADPDQPAAGRGGAGRASRRDADLGDDDRVRRGAVATAAGERAMSVRIMPER